MNEYNPHRIDSFERLEYLIRIELMELRYSDERATFLSRLIARHFCRMALNQLRLTGSHYDTGGEIKRFEMAMKMFRDVPDMKELVKKLKVLWEAGAFKYRGATHTNQII